MGKASRRKASARQAGQQRRADSAQTRPAPFVARPFEGLPGETDWVALREIVPAATATIRLQSPADAPAQDATVATVLPMAWSGMRRNDGQLFVALQSGTTTGDASRDIAQVLLALADAPAGTPLPAAQPATADTPRLQDVLDLSHPFEVTVHDGFDFWVGEAAELDDEAKASLERANESVVPTARLHEVDSAYWCRLGERTHLRWVLPYDEDAATNALARLYAAHGASLGSRTRLLGAFRACGLLVPVWDLDAELEADDYEKPALVLKGQLEDALADTRALSEDERRARAGLVNRQITLR